MLMVFDGRVLFLLMLLSWRWSNLFSLASGALGHHVLAHEERGEEGRRGEEMR